MTPNLFDSLTRASAQPMPGLALWQTLRSGLASMLPGTADRTVSANRTVASPAESCIMLNHDASCPPNTNKQAKPGNTPSANGCGPEGGTIKIPQGFGSADYTGSCNQHDYCYEECNTPKSTCDEDFRDDMYDACAAAYPGALYALLRFSCYERAYAYYQAVAQFGDDAWLAGQKKACECCVETPKIYCNCNKKCYDDVQVCLDECKATLGCFTGICGYAEPGQCPA